MRLRFGPQVHRANNFCLLVFLRGPAEALLSVVACYLKTKEMQLGFNKQRAATPLLGLNTVQSAPGLYTLQVLDAYVDLRIVEVSNAHKHLVGATEEFPYRRLRVGCQPNAKVARDLPAVEKMGGRFLAPARALQCRLSWVESLVVFREVSVLRSCCQKIAQHSAR